jgi:hypothetical protein
MLSRARRKIWAYSSGPIPRTQEPSSKLLRNFGAPLQGVSPADFVDSTTFQIGKPPDRIDILQRIDGVTFEEAWENRVEGTIDGELPL